MCCDISFEMNQLRGVSLFFMHRIVQWMAGVALLAFQAEIAHANVRLPAIISEHAVLQKSPATAVWGWSGPREKVTVTLDKISATATADAHGFWKANLDLTQLGSGPFTLQVQGKNTLTVPDVLVGDVWLSSGQSNMQFTLNSTTDADAEIEKSANPSLRWFMAKSGDKFVGPQQDVQGEWFISSPDTAGDCSAVAYYFGKKIQADRHIPIGLVLTAVGGTTIQSWMSRKTLAEPDVKAALDQAFPPPAPARSKTTKHRQDPQLVPSFFYNQLIYPLANLSLSGVIWYQGEAHFNQGEFYDKAFPALIRSWRALWRQPALPFYFCQLPNIDKKTPDPAMEGWIAGLRESQNSGLQEPNTGEAILIDAGTEDLHPPGKKVVGDRLALLAEAETYGMSVKAQSPRFDSAAMQGDRVEIHFRDCANGLVADDPPKDMKLYSPGSAVQGFAICGADQKWVWAQATISGDKVTVWSPKVPHPAAVRYAWANNPTCNLYGKNGLPAAPFQAKVK